MYRNNGFGIRAVLLAALLLLLPSSAFAGYAVCGNQPCGAYTVDLSSNHRHIKISFLHPLVTDSNFLNIKASNTAKTSNGQLLKNALYAINYGGDTNSDYYLQFGYGTLIPTGKDSNGNPLYKLYLYPPGYVGLADKANSDAELSDTCNLNATTELTVAQCYAGFVTFPIPSNAPTGTGDGCQPKDKGGNNCSLPTPLPVEPLTLSITVDSTIPPSAKVPLNPHYTQALPLVLHENFAVNYECINPDCCT